MSLLKIQGFVSALWIKTEYQAILKQIVDNFSTSKLGYSLQLADYHDDVEWLILSSILGSLFDSDTKQLRAYFMPEDAHYLGVACLIGFAYQGRTTEIYLSELSKCMLGFSDDFDQALRRVGHVVGWGSSSRALKHIETQNQKWDDVLVAIYYLMQFPDAFSHKLADLSSQAALLLSIIANLQNEPQATNPDIIKLAQTIQTMKANL